MRIELHPRWLILFVSLVPLFVLRGHRTGLMVWGGVVFLLLTAAIFWLPRRVAAAERTFQRDALKALSSRDFAGLEALVDRQRLLRAFGRRHLLSEMRALAASASGRHEEARTLYRRALDEAPADERTRLEVNLAGEELATGQLAEAEGRYRTVLKRRPDLPIALSNLGRLLAQRASTSDELEEAIGLLRRALPMADARERADLEGALAEAVSRVRTGGGAVALGRGPG
jgi:tetratricopeptide (TPR) repeat protein